ncbi:MAG: PGPGW domain-containing protein [Verrucomicrobiota bacterium]|jgi:hypothetical protein
MKQKNETGMNGSLPHMPREPEGTHLDLPERSAAGSIEKPNSGRAPAGSLWRGVTSFIFDRRPPVSQTNQPPTVLRWFKRTMIMIVGGTVFAIGVAMIVLPGPAFIVIPAGLAILAIEFAWARRWLRSIRAVLPLRGHDHPVREKISLKSIRRSLEFLFRQVRRSVLPK